MRLTLSSQLIPYVIKQASLMEWADRNKELAGMLLGAAGGTAVQGVRRALHDGPEEDAPSYLDGALTGGLLGAAGGGAMRLLRGRPMHSPEELAAARASGAKANPFQDPKTLFLAGMANDSALRDALAAGRKNSTNWTPEAALEATKHIPPVRIGGFSAIPLDSAIQHPELSGIKLIEQLQALEHRKKVLRLAGF